MKTKLQIFLILFCLCQIHSKAQTYTFSHSTSTYTDLPSPTILSAPYWDDFSLFSTIIPFQFQLFGVPFDTIYLYSDEISLDPTFASYGIASYTYCELVDNSTNTASISIQTTGIAPNRIFKLQIKDAAFYDDTSGTDYTNYQLWLYETTNVAEIHFGPNSVLNPQSWNVPGATGPGVAIAINQNNGLILNGPAANPIAYSIGSASTLTISGAPTNGMVYIFTPSTTSVNDFENNNVFQIFPNPNNGTFEIMMKSFTTNIKFSVYDLQGKRVYSHDSFQYGYRFNLSLSTGMYIAEIQDGDRILRRNFVVQ